MKHNSQTKLLTSCCQSWMSYPLGMTLTGKQKRETMFLYELKQACLNLQEEINFRPSPHYREAPKHMLKAIPTQLNTGFSILLNWDPYKRSFFHDSKLKSVLFKISDLPFCLESLLFLLNMLTKPLSYLLMFDIKIKMN